MALTLVGLAAAGVVVWRLFTRLLRGDWPWQVGALDESTPGKDTTQIVLTVIAGLGAAVALVVAYRRQRDLELARFDERFAAAAAQLGAPTAAERLARHGQLQGGDVLRRHGYPGRRGFPGLAPARSRPTS